MCAPLTPCFLPIVTICTRAIIIIIIIHCRHAARTLGRPILLKKFSVLSVQLDALHNQLHDVSGQHTRQKCECLVPCAYACGIDHVLSGPVHANRHCQKLLAVPTPSHRADRGPHLLLFAAAVGAAMWTCGHGVACVSTSRERPGAVLNNLTGFDFGHDPHRKSTRSLVNPLC